MSRWDALLAVQAHDTTLDQLVHRRATLPERTELDGLMAQVAQLDGALAEVEAARHVLQRDQQRLEDEIATVAAKADSHDKALYSGTVTNPRELQAMQDEVASLRKRIGQLEDQELEVLEQLEPLDAEVARLTGERGALDEQAAALRARIAEGEVEVDGLVEAERAERASAAAGVEAALLEQYEGLRKRTGGIAIARLVGANCGGCHLQLAAAELDRLRKLPPDEPATCEECGRLLVR